MKKRMYENQRNVCSTCMDIFEDFLEEKGVVFEDSITDDSSGETIVLVNKSYDLLKDSLNRFIRQLPLDDFIQEKENILLNVKTWTFTILEIFENFLYRKNCNIENDEKKGNKEEAIVYGSDYHKLEELIKGIFLQLEDEE